MRFDTPRYDLDLSAATRVKLDAVSALARELQSAVGPDFLQSSDFAPLLSVTTAALSSSLQPCPFAPAGVNVAPDWDPVSYNFILKCQHPGHCWRADGTYYPCP